MTTDNELFRTLLGENPQAVFESALTRLPQQSSFMTRFFRDEFDDILNEFRGRAVGQLENNEFPTQTFGESLQQFPFLQRFLSRSPLSRGDTSGRLLAPSLSFTSGIR